MISGFGISLSAYFNQMGWCELHPLYLPVRNKCVRRTKNITHVSCKKGEMPCKLKCKRKKYFTTPFQLIFQSKGYFISKFYIYYNDWNCSFLSYSRHEHVWRVRFLVPYFKSDRDCFPVHGSWHDWFKNYTLLTVFVRCIVAKRWWKYDG